MAQHRPEISNHVKKRLRREAGNKCANPGCPNVRTHLHHIREWAVYATHDAQHMIAVCPTCHDAIHHGSISISDEKIYEWKKITRPQSTVRTHLYIEPGTFTKVVLGSIAISAPQEAIVFNLSQNNRLKFRIVENEILLLDLRVASMSGKEIVRVTDNHVRHDVLDPIGFKQVPGHIEVTAPATPGYIPTWVVQKMRVQEPAFANSGEVKMLSMEVIRPGIVRVEGIWAESNHAVVVTSNLLSFVTAGLREPISLAGDGEDSVLQYVGPITTSMFGFR